MPHRLRWDLRRRMAVPWLLAVPLLLAGSAQAAVLTAGADSAATAALADSGLARLLADLERDTRLRLRVRGDGILDGVLVRTHAESLVVSPELFEGSTVHFDDIETLWLQHGHHQHQGMLWGAPIGAIGVPLIPSALVYMFSFEGNPNPTGAILIGIPMGFVSGAVIGSGIGRLTPAWEQRYSEPASGADDSNSGRHE